MSMEVQFLYFIQTSLMMTPVDCKDIPGGSESKAFAYNAGDLGLIPGSGSLTGYSPRGPKEPDTTG